MNTKTDVTRFEALRGEAGIRALVARFYGLMNELPEQVTDEELRSGLMSTFARMAEHMINTETGSAPCSHALRAS